MKVTLTPSQGPHLQRQMVQGKEGSFLPRKVEVDSYRHCQDNAEIWRYLPSDKHMQTRSFPMADIDIQNNTR